MTRVSHADSPVGAKYGEVAVAVAVAVAVVVRPNYTTRGIHATCTCPISSILGPRYVWPQVIAMQISRPTRVVGFLGMRKDGPTRVCPVVLLYHSLYSKIK